MMKREFDNTSEIWKDISWTDGKYQVSNLGNVRHVWKKRKNVLSPYATGGGYLCVNINNRRAKVHKLVADAFILNINEYPQIDHINRNKIDNRRENLRFVTPSDNNRNRSNNHRITIGNETMCIAEWSEKTGVSADCIRKRLKNGWNPCDAILKPTRKKRVKKHE